ncbi:1-phosphatidylinositol 4,5-bisphosphate phosphodiesterase eta-1 isoform 1-T1 [Synchiropus picturatus]
MERRCSSVFSSRALAQPKTGSNFIHGGKAAVVTVATLLARNVYHIGGIVAVPQKCRLVQIVERCMSVMQSGTQMVKLKAGSKGLVRLFYLDEHRSCIRWKPSRKSEKAKITIDSLYKVTEGSQSDIFHRHPEGSFDSTCCFTVYHGNHMESLDLVTSNSDEARTWITGLRYLMAGISDEDSLAKRQRTHDQWMKQTFEEADKNGDGLLNIDEIYQLLHKLNVNLPRRKVKQMFQEADTDDQQGTLTYEEFSVFYKMMSLRRDLFLLMMAYSDRKDHLTTDELANFLRNEQKMSNVTPEYVDEIIEKFEVSDEYKQKGVMGIEGFTSFMRSPTCDIFNPLHHEVNQDMDQPLCNYFIASSHNTYLTGDQLLSHSKTDMYAWVLQSGCRCVEVDCWDGPEGEPMVQHGYTLTSKIPFRSVIETINKYAFVNNQYPVILSIENHCSIQQQKKIAQYLREVFGERLDVGEALSGDFKTLPSPQSLQGKILIKGKRLPAYLSADAEEGEVSDDDSADEIEDDFKLKSSNGNGHHQVESHIRKKLDSLLKESLIGDKEDTDSFSIRALLRATHQGLQKNLRQSSKGVLKKSQSRSFITTLKQKRHSKSRLSCQSVEKEDDEQERPGREAGGQFNRGGRKRKTMKLSRDLSNLVVFTNSVASQECLNEGTPSDVLSFSETRAQSLVHHRTEQFLTFNQRQLSRIYPSAYRIDSSNFNPQFYWNVGCQLVALNYQTEGRMMQLNRAKFMVNGGSGYVLKPPPMCKGSFNPFSDDPLPAYPKKQLILKIISGQQLPKPPDSMLGDRGEIIDPFVEVEIIGLPVDCCKEQTRVVDDNGFNPVWEETLSFTLHMAEVALVRFLVWDHDPIGRDFIGQRTVAFSSLMHGYRHVYLEGLTEASIFVHVSVHDVYGKWSPLVLNPSFTIMHFLGSNKGGQLRGIRGFFNRSSKSSVDTNSGGLRKRSISDHLLRRTASAPAKGRKKTKMPLSESVASISEQKNGTTVGAVGEGVSGKEGAVEKRAPPRAPLTHRPISMPLDRLLQGQLTLCSQEEQHDNGADSITGHFPFHRPRSSSVDHVCKSPTSFERNTSTPSKFYISRIAEESSYLVIGGEELRKEDDYANYQIEDKLKSEKSLMKNQISANKTETSSNSTTFTVAPSVSSSSSSSAPSSVAPLSPITMDYRVKSPSSVDDSAISRLIDAVSLGNEQDTRGSISALISQMDIDQTGISGSPATHLSNMRSTTPKDLRSSQSTASNGGVRSTAPPALLSSPETADAEEVYTILDEEMLSPGPTSNTKAQTVHIQMDRTPSNSLRSSPAKGVQSFGKGWIDRNIMEVEEESVYEEVYDPPELWRKPSQSFTLNHYPHRNPLAEVEINVDEDPCEATSPHGRRFEELSSPTKRHAIYQNNESTPKFPHQPSNSDPRYQYPAHVLNVTFSPCPSPLGRPSNHLQRSASSQASPFHRAPDLRTASPVNCFMSQMNPADFTTSRDFSLSEAQQRCFNKSSHQDAQEPRQAEREHSRFHYNGVSSPDALPRFPVGSTNSCRSRPVSSPSLDFQSLYSQVDYESVLVSPESSTARNLKPSPLKSPLSHSHSAHDTRPETKARRSLHPATSPCPTSLESSNSTPCKSKSLGDLTSEDISCNFQSKYHIISRSFITPHMRRQRRMGSPGEAAVASPSCDPLTEQLRKLVSLDGDDVEKDLPLSCRVSQEGETLRPRSQPTPSSRDLDDSPPPLTRRLSSRSQSRVRHINSRARERQQEALKPRTGVLVNNSGGIVLRSKPASQNPPVNRHSTGSYIAGFLGHFEDRGLPEGSCTSLRNGNLDHHGDLYYAGDNVQPDGLSHFPSEPEVYFLLRL